MPHQDDLAELDDTSLDGVNGGVAAATSGDSNPQLASALQGITDEISKLGKHNVVDSTSSSFALMLPMMMMMMGGGGGGCPCGCGMAHCCRRR